MGRTSPSQVAALDLIDKLFFNQILVCCFFTEELCWLNDLDTEIELELTHRNIDGAQRQLVKHCVLCLMEAELSESLSLLKEAYPDKVPDLPADLTLEQHEKIARYRLDFFEAVVLASMSKLHQCDMGLPIEITNILLEKYSEAPATVRYRLVERMFAFNFISAPIDCFTWLAKMGVLKSTKHSGAWLISRYPPGFLQRLALLCEFDMLRDYIRRASSMGGTAGNASVEQICKIRKLSQQTMRLLVNRMAKDMEVNSMPNLKNSFPAVSLDELENPASVERFFASLNSYAIRFRAFPGTLASWVGMLCGGGVEVLHCLQDKKNPIYAAEFNEGTLTQYISDGMKSRGFDITPRAIYERHRDFKETTFKAVSIYYQMKLVENVAIPPDVKDITYEAISWHFELLKPAPRRRPRSPIEKLEQ